MKDDQHIAAPTKLHKYFHMLPNLYDDAGLDPYEYRLLGHYVRRGNCWESLNETANHCRMSRRTAIEKRDSLAAKGFIQLSKNRRTDTVRIEVIDRWDENFLKYASAPAAPENGVASAPNALASAPAAHGLVRQVHTKKNPMKCTHSSKTSRAHPSMRPGWKNSKPNIQGPLSLVREDQRRSGGDDGAD